MGHRPRRIDVVTRSGFVGRVIWGGETWRRTQ